MNRLIRIAVLTGFFTLISPLSLGATEEEIPLIGPGELNEIQTSLPSRIYSKRLSAVVVAMNESLTKAVNKTEIRNGAQLKTIVVGAGLGVEVALGPILKVKAVPRVRLVFSADAEPIIP